MATTIPYPGRAYPDWYWPLTADPVLKVAPFVAQPRGVTPRLDVWMCDSRGYTLDLLRPLKKYVALDVFGFGSGFKLEMPAVWPRQLARPGNKIVFELVYPGLFSTLLDVFVLLDQPAERGARGTVWFDLAGPSLTGYYLGPNSRIVDEWGTGLDQFYAGSADEVVKRLVKITMGEGAEDGRVNAGGRDLTMLVGFTVQRDQGLGPEIKEWGWGRPLQDVLESIVKKSEMKGRRLYLWCRAVGLNPLRVEFVTKMDYLGRDRRLGMSANPVVLAPELGTIKSVEREHDFTESYSAVVVNYHVNSLTRVINAPRRNLWVDGYREGWFADGASGTEADAQEEGGASLAEGKERRIMRLKVGDTSLTREGVEYGLGDLVTAYVMGEFVDYEVTGLEVAEDAGKVQKTIRVEQR